MPMSLRRFLFPCLLATTLALAALPAHADENNAIHFGRAIHITADMPVHDAVCFFCGVHAEGKVTGDIVVFFGNVHLNGDAQHDVVNIFGDVTAEKGSTIDNDLVSIFGNVRLGESVVVGQDLVALFGSLNAPESVIVGGDRVEQPAWIIALPLIVLIIFVVLLVRGFRAYRRRLLARSFPPIPRH